MRRFTLFLTRPLTSPTGQVAVAGAALALSAPLFMLVGVAFLLMGDWHLTGTAFALAAAALLLLLAHSWAITHPDTLAERLRSPYDPGP